MSLPLGVLALVLIAVRLHSFVPAWGIKPVLLRGGDDTPSPVTVLEPVTGVATESAQPSRRRLGLPLPVLLEIRKTGHEATPT